MTTNATPSAPTFEDARLPPVSAAALLLIAATELAAGTLTIEPSAPTEPCPACGQSVSASSGGLGRLTVHEAAGPVYEASEEDLLTALEEKAKESLRSGEWGREMTALRERAVKAADRPEGVPLPRSERNTLTVEPLPDRLPEGHPLKAALANFERRYLLVDADDPAALRWAAEKLAADDPARSANLRVVLTNGSVRQTGDLLGRRVWFDARGALSRRFGLTAQPALVTLSDRAITVVTPDLSRVDEAFAPEPETALPARSNVPGVRTDGASDAAPQARPEAARRSGARLSVAAEGAKE